MFSDNHKGWVVGINKGGVIMKDVMGFEYGVVNKVELGLNKLEELLKGKGNVWNKGVRNWEWSIGKVEQYGENEWLWRVMLGVGLQFNYWQDKEYGELKSESVWEWCKGDLDEDEFFEERWNLNWQRWEIVRRVKREFGWIHRNGRMVEVLQSGWFWKRLNVVWNLGVGDVVGKKVVLFKMICEDMGWKVWKGMMWGEGCVDYNVMVMLNVLNIRKIEGKVWDKEELDKERVWINGWCKMVCRVKGIGGSELDGVLFMVGRMLRSQMGSNDLVPKVLGEVNY